MIGLQHFLILAAALFCIGFYCAVVKKNAIAVFMGIELMLNSANINLVAFNRYIAPDKLDGHVFAIFVMVVAAVRLPWTRDDRIDLPPSQVLYSR
jgi:NADH:ubiquinone oxidoreductase subunit K